MMESDLATRLVEVENDNRRLRQMLSQTPATRELRHRLSNTHAMLRTIIRKSAETSHDIEVYVAHVEDRMDAFARAQATADAFGEIELGNMFANELLQFGAPEGKRSHLAGPTVFLQPHAGQMMTLAAHELATNALEHGALTTRSGRIDVSWDVTSGAAGNELTIVWKESGLRLSADATREGFGTDVLTRMLAYELGAVTAFERETDGVRWMIRLALSESVGRVEGAKPNEAVLGIFDDTNNTFTGASKDVRSKTG